MGIFKESGFGGCREEGKAVESQNASVDRFSQNKQVEGNGKAEGGEGLCIIYWEQTLEHPERKRF